MMTHLRRSFCERFASAVKISTKKQEENIMPCIVKQFVLDSKPAVQRKVYCPKRGPSLYAT